MTNTPIDRAVFTELQDAMGADFVAELVDTFLNETPGILAEISDAAATGDQDKFRRAAHSIKSNAEIFGAGYLVDLARQMELSTLDPDPEENTAAISKLRAAYDRASATLKELKNA